MSARFNLEFPDDYKQIVAELMEKTGLRTQKDVFENALALFSWGVREISRGRVIASLDEESKTYAQIHMPALMKIRPSTPPEEEGEVAAKRHGKSRALQEDFPTALSALRAPEEALPPSLPGRRREAATHRGQASRVSVSAPTRARNRVERD